MPRIPDLNRNPLDQIEYLVLRKFPRLSWDRSNAVRGLDRFQPEGDTIEDVKRAAEEYRQELFKKSPDELKALVSAARDDQQRLAEALEAAKERARFFNQPSAVADFDHWSKCAHWTIDEAVALSFGKAPEIVTRDAVKPYLNVSPFAKGYMRRYDLAIRALPWKRLFDPVLPSIFLAWARRMRLSVSPELTAKVEALGVVIADWQDMCEQQRKTIADLSDSREAIEQELITQRGVIDALVQQRDEALAKAKALEAQVWDGFDPDADDYPEELDLAFTAWRAVHNSPTTEQKPKDQIRAWLNANAPKSISPEARERIAVVCNWKKGGGRPRS